MNAQDKLPFKVKAGYGAGDLGGNLFFTVVAFWLMIYLTDEAGLSPALAGAALMVGKIWDAVTDPAVGYLSDRTRTRWGRRRPWILFGSMPLGLAFAYLFINPGLRSQTSLFIWAALAYMLVCMVYTFVNIPYNALTPELTKDYNERTTLNGFRMAFAVVGTLTGAGAAMPLIHLTANRTQGYMLMGAIFGGIMTFTALIPFLMVREPPLPAKATGQGLLSSYRDAFRNKPFLLILFPWAFNIVGITVVTATLVYYFKYIYRNEAMVTGALVVMLLASMIFIPITVRVSRHIGKRNTYIAGMSLMAAAVLVFFFLGHLLSPNFCYPIMAAAGIGLSTHYVMPWSIIPDTVEYDYAQSGVRREGIYYGLWTFTIKMGQAAAGLMVGLVLDFCGYIPNVEQTASAVWGIRFLVGPATALFFILGNIVLAYYPIDARRYDEIRQRIAEMEETDAPAVG